METPKFSLLWADTDPRTSFADFSFVNDLRLGQLIDLSAGRKVGEMEQPLSAFFSTHLPTLTLRCDLFLELLDAPDFYRELRGCFAQLSDLRRLGQEKEGRPDTESSLYSIRELEMYVAFFDRLQRLFQNHPAQSALLARIQAKTFEICESGEYVRLKEEIGKLSHSVDNVHSVTVGINLNAQFQPIEAGVVKINEESYVSGSFIEKLLKLDFEESEFLCATPLIPVTKGATPAEEGALRIAMNSALNKLLSSALRSWSGVIRKYTLHGVDWLFPLLPEMNFLVACTDLLYRLKGMGKPLCRPEFGDTDRVSGLYHPLLTLSRPDTVVENDLTFDENGRIYILTGPNQGGKSIYTSAVGILYAMLHLGLPLPAGSAVIRPADAILTHFADRQDASYKQGRFAAECGDLQRISAALTPNSLFLFDEALSSTGSGEAAVLAEEILDAYAEIGPRGIWATHLHELCSLPDRMTGGKSRLCNLTATIDPATHQRKYLIEKGDPFGKSYAMDIARQYKLTRADILSGR